VTAEDLRPLAGMVELLASPGFKFGDWQGGERRADGVITMPYYDLSDRGLEVVRAMPVRLGFDWQTWKDTPEAIGLVTDHALIASATAEQVVRLSTLIVRQDRFFEGLLASAFESGLLLALAKRSAALTTPDQPDQTEANSR
jgi:hypothetical protein